MSLKAFHILFITVAVLMILGCATGALLSYLETGAGFSLAAALGSLVAAATLVVYEVVFIRKTKGVL